MVSWSEIFRFQLKKNVYEKNAKMNSKSATHSGFALAKLKEKLEICVQRGTKSVLERERRRQRYLLMVAWQLAVEPK